MRANSLDFTAWTSLIEETEKAAEVCYVDLNYMLGWTIIYTFHLWISWSFWLVYFVGVVNFKVLWCNFLLEYVRFVVAVLDAHWVAYRGWGCSFCSGRDTVGCGECYCYVSCVSYYLLNIFLELFLVQDVGFGQILVIFPFWDFWDIFVTHYRITVRMRLYYNKVACK